jgi:hypothetical protein
VPARLLPGKMRISVFIPLLAFLFLRSVTMIKFLLITGGVVIVSFLALGFIGYLFSEPDWSEMDAIGDYNRYDN